MRARGYISGGPRKRIKLPLRPPPKPIPPKAPPPPRARGYISGGPTKKVKLRPPPPPKPSPPAPPPPPKPILPPVPAPPKPMPPVVPLPPKPVPPPIGSRVTLGGCGSRRGGGCIRTRVRILDSEGRQVALLIPGRVMGRDCLQAVGRVRLPVGERLTFEALARGFGFSGRSKESPPVTPECESPTGYYLPQRLFACVEWPERRGGKARTWWTEYPCRGA